MLIVLDLEWNRSYDNKPLEEILQIGAVRVSSLGGPILDQFQVYIKPVVHKRFDPGARSLPDLQASKDSTIEFPEAYQAFREWCGEIREFAAWGSDFKTFDQNCAYWNLPPLKVDRVHDLQYAFSWVAGTRQQVSLHCAVEYCGLPAPFTFHNALNDAMYTSLVAAWIPEGAQEERLASKFSPYPYPDQPARQIDALLHPQDALNDRRCRKIPCPVCGRPAWVLQWLRRGSEPTPRFYYGVFACPDHDRFLSRLTLNRTGPRSWTGLLEVPVISHELMREYDAAREGSVFVCKGNSKKSRKRRKRRAKKSS